MPSHNEPVQPARFDAADEIAATASSSAQSGGGKTSDGRWIVPALALLVILALLVVFWLPGKIGAPSEPSDTTVPVTAPDPGAGTAREGAQTTNRPSEAPAETADKTPWADAQQARLRLEAQDVLGDLLDLQFELEERSVEVWAPGPYAEAKAQAAEGDRLYRDQQYAEAGNYYQRGLEALQALSDGLPELLAEKLRESGTAIARGDIAAASAALAAVSAMEPEHEDIPALQARLSTLPQVLENLARARKREENDDLDGAAELLATNLELDPLHTGSAQALDRVRDAIHERDFQTAMSRGYSALTSNRYPEARSSFEQALALRPGSAEAQSALLEVESAASTSSLAALQSRGRTLEREERWQDAVKVYERALQIDSSVTYATAGIERARERARVDEQFQTIFDEPSRLSDVAVAAEASDFLRHARQISPPGAVLQSQIRRLEDMLRLANTPVPVTLSSDMETEVTVYKVARLGKFQQQELSLRPGTYTAVGTRVGFRDVRREFTVAHDSGQTIVTVVCSEPI